MEVLDIRRQRQQEASVRRFSSLILFSAAEPGSTLIFYGNKGQTPKVQEFCTSATPHYDYNPNWYGSGMFNGSYVVIKIFRSDENA